MFARQAVIAVALTLVLASGGAHANRKSAIQVSPDQPVPVQLDEVLGLLNHEDYEEIGNSGRTQVRQAVASIRSIMGSRSELNELNPNERIEVLNQREIINTVMGQAHADSRMVCERHKPIGSNRPTRVCMTVAERKRAQEKSEQMMRDGSSRHQPFDPGSL